MYSNPAWGTRTRVWRWLTNWLYQTFSFICGASYLDPTYTFQPWMDPKPCSLYKYFTLLFKHPIIILQTIHFYIGVHLLVLTVAISLGDFVVWVFSWTANSSSLPPFPHLTSDTMQMFSSEIFLRESHKVWAKTGNIFTKNLIWSIRSAGSTASSWSIGRSLQDPSHTWVLQNLQDL